MTPIQNALAHVSLGTNHFAQSAAFYDAVLAPLGIKRILDMSEHHAIVYGRAYPEFWIQRPINGQPAQSGNGTHIAFFAENPAQVDAFYAAALAAGATDDGAPGGRPHYGPAYYGCFVRDPDGHKIEAMAYQAP